MARSVVSLTLVLMLTAVLASWRVVAGPQNATPPRLEGCVSCHGLIEPMHKYGTTKTFDKLKDGKDAVGLSCTACHGGNPASLLKEQANVKALYPREWRRAGGYSGANADVSHTLL